MRKINSFIRNYSERIDWLVVCISSLVVICVLSVIGLLIATGVYCYEEATRDPYAGTVIDKYYKAGDTTYYLNDIGGTIINTPITDNAEWRVVIDDGTDKPKTFTVTEKQFHKIQKGDYVKEDK